MCVLEIVKTAPVVVEVTNQHLTILVDKVLNCPIAVFIISENIIGMGSHNESVEPRCAIHHALTDILLVETLGLLIGKVNYED